jgi:hypothetical protein
VQVDVKGMGDEYEVDSDADPEHDDNDNDAALLLALREIVDNSCCRRDTAEVDHQRLARADQ